LVHDMVSRHSAALTLGALLALTSIGFGARDFGVGILLGQPSGLKTSISIREPLFLDCGAAWSWDDWLLIFADCRFEEYVSPRSLNWRWYYGLGGYVGIPESEDGILGARIPIGASYHFPYSSFEVFGELVPALQLVPKTRARLQGGIGLLVWF
jgi:hypothetical protein